MEIELDEMREFVKKILAEINRIPAEKLSQYRIVQQMDRTIDLVRRKKPDAFIGGRVSDEELLDDIGCPKESLLLPFCFLNRSFSSFAFFRHPPRLPVLGDSRYITLFVLHRVAFHHKL